MVALPSLPSRQFCPTVHLITTRGTFEEQSPGDGVMGYLTTSIKNRVPGSDSSVTQYPGDVSPYNTSEAYGVGNLTASIQSYVAACPRTPLVLLGYSQGAQVVSNVLCGTSENKSSVIGPFPPTPPLDFAAYGKNVKAVLLWGDPTFMANQSYNKGADTTHDGIFGRNNVRDCQRYAGVMGSWCAEGDLVCDRTGGDGAAHVSYVFQYVDQGTEFAVGLLRRIGVFTT